MDLYRLFWGKRVAWLSHLCLFPREGNFAARSAREGNFQAPAVKLIGSGEEFFLASCLFRGFDGSPNGFG